MRLIDADAFEAELNERLLPVLIERYGRDEVLKGLHFSFRDCICNIQTQPTIEPEPQWIPCSERLPEESGRYLVSVLDGVGRRTTVAPYQPRYKAWTMTGRMTYWKVVAWMPLPEPYREDKPWSAC